MEPVVIVSGARTPIGRFRGRLSTVAAPQLGAVALSAAVERAGLSPDAVDYVIMGNAIAAGVGQTPARQAGIAAGIPPTTSALTVNKACASGLMAVVLAAQNIALGEAQVVAAGGMESMSLAPHLLAHSRRGIPIGPGELVDAMIFDGLWCPFENRHMGNSAEDIARKYNIGRAEQDAFALRSHQRAVAARRNFDAEIAPVTVPGPPKVGGGVVEADEGPRPDTSLEALAKLAPAFEPQGTVTPGNSSQISDGAAALVLMAEGRATRLPRQPMARILGYTHSAIEPRWLFDAPVLAVRQLLEKTGLALGDFDLIEINEAFAAQTLANGHVLGWDWDRVNVKGGAIALGHPIGASGARILVTLLYSLEQRALRRGLAVVCHGGGGAVAMAMERVGGGPL
ncbi:MAG: acetyl-CoA C-acetyltransferase [Chloroflexi bacterium]|nr:acetyl-CoA C-acetyltransferase [Chloroflexota bacterium]